MLTASVESGGFATREPSKAEALAAGMRDTLREGGALKIGKLADAMGEKKGSGTWERARKLALDKGWITQAEGSGGIYEAGPEEPEL